MCDTMGTAVATIAVARYIELSGVATAKPTKSEYERLAQHFEHKTGCSLNLETHDGGAEAYRLLDQLLQKSGNGVAVELLKRAVGL
jgi:hypothetical protein